MVMVWMGKGGGTVELPFSQIIPRAANGLFQNTSIYGNVEPYIYISHDIITQ